MGKKKSNQNALGRSIIKDRFGGRKLDKDSMLHTSEIGDGFDWNRLNLKSVTEESALDEFLSTAELAGTEFTAEKLNIKFVNPGVGQGVITREERARLEQVHAENNDWLRIPRRPKWDASMSAEQLQQLEREEFLAWRQRLAQLQEGQDDLLMTPFEKNLEFWRQLWRVVEKSDVVVQILDARNPLLFRCEDLEQYVDEVSMGEGQNKNKLNVLLINKADLLTGEQRQIWADYFSSIHITAVFFSAVTGDKPVIEEESDESDGSSEGSSDSEDDDDVENNEHSVTEDTKPISEDTKIAGNKIVNEVDSHPKEPELKDFDDLLYSGSVLSREQLILFFKSLHKGQKLKEGVTTIGLVGYPNVGKSSTINAILTHKKVSVSATPGKTKHFQTLFVDNELLLCDCPGLVFPNFVSTKADMVVNGILPIDEMRDHVPPVNLVGIQFPRKYLEQHYSILLPPLMEGEDPDRAPTAEELLNSYGYMRGFMTQRGLPDLPRSARYVLKDYVQGKLLYCHAPPGISQDTYHPFSIAGSTNRDMTPQQQRINRSTNPTASDLDGSFFNKKSAQAHTKGVQGVSGYARRDGFTNQHSTSQENMGVHILGRKEKGHKKKEKLRRVYSHLDH